MSEATGLTVVEPAPLTVVPTAKGARESLQTYLEIQRVFDEMMPDAIMTIGKKKFRKKSYWRGIATAFGVECKIIAEERIETPDGDWGWTATARATTRDGRICDGDGACMATEKIVYLWEGRKRTEQIDKVKTKQNQSVHNVRSHANTRARNRAISDLVGFGEVSAEEISTDPAGDAKSRQTSRQKGPESERTPDSEGADSANLATEQRIKMLTAKSYARVAEHEQEAEAFDGTINYESRDEHAGAIRKAAKHVLALGEVGNKIPAAAVNSMMRAIGATVINADGKVEIPDGVPF